MITLCWRAGECLRDRLGDSGISRADRVAYDFPHARAFRDAVDRTGRGPTP